MWTLLFLALAHAAPTPTTVFIVRHAEKATGENPPLTEAGLERARTLATVLADTKLDAVYTTNLCRTAQTVDLIAKQQGLELQVLDVSPSDLDGCVPALVQPRVPLEREGDAHDALVRELRTLAPGSTALVAGHSNTIPDILVRLGAPPVCPDLLPLDDKGRCWIGDRSYDNLFVVTLPKRGPATVQRLHVGPPSPQ